MKHVKTIVSFFLIVLITSCSNDDGPESDSQNNSSDKVFVVGVEAKGAFLVPVIWTDGKKNYLPTVADTDMDDLKVAVHNNDVYVAGVETTSAGKRSIVLWKNGIQSRFSSTADYVEIIQMIVDNGNVYILGKERLSGVSEKYTYWKNGVATPIINSSVAVANDSEENYVSKMTIANNDVYCIGYEWNTAGTVLTGKYWKNAVPTTVAIFKDEIFDFLQEIQVNGNDISIVYNQLNTATFAQETKLWKNNTVSVLASGTSDFFAAGMIIKDGVEHILIKEEISGAKTKLLYLKDRVKTEITDGSFDIAGSYIRVDGSNVCIAYYTDLTFTYTSKYWLNGTTKTLSGHDEDPFDTFFLAGTNVYMTTKESFNPFIWINGKETALPFDANTNFAIAHDVFVTQ